MSSHFSKSPTPPQNNQQDTSTLEVSTTLQISYHKIQLIFSQLKSIIGDAYYSLQCVFLFGIDVLSQPYETKWSLR